MVLPQPGIFAVGTSAHAYLELDLLTDADPVAAVHVLADLAERETTMGATNLVVGVRPELWARVSPGTLPTGLTGFDDAVVGADGFTMPATQHDLALWFAAASYDVVFDATLDAVRKLAPLAALVSEVPRLDLPPRPRPDRLRGRHREPDARAARRRTPWCPTGHPGPAARCCSCSSGSMTRRRGGPSATTPRRT